MSRVFTFREISGGAVPRIEDFPKFVSHIRREAGNELCVVAGVVSGPVLRGDYEVGDRVSLTLVRRMDGARAVGRLKGRLDDRARELHIPLRIQVYDIDSAWNGRHPLGPMAMGYLELAIMAGGIIKDNPARYFKSLPMAPQWELERYLVMKCESLQLAARSYGDMSEDERVVALGQSFSCPFAVASRLLQFARPFAWLSVGATRAGVALIYPSLATRHGAKVFAELLKYRSSYKTALSKELARPDMNVYVRSLSAFHVAVKLAHEFVEDNLSLLGTIEQG